MIADSPDNASAGLLDVLFLVLAVVLFANPELRRAAAPDLVERVERGTSGEGTVAIEGGALRLDLRGDAVRHAGKPIDGKRLATILDAAASKGVQQIVVRADDRTRLATYRRVLAAVQKVGIRIIRHE